DYHTITPYHIITIITSAFVGVAIWRWKITGLADCFAIIAMAVILPVHYDFVMMPIIILVATFFLVVTVVTMYNVFLNLSDIIRSKRLDIFSEFQSESKIKKIFAFFTVHGKREYERFVIPAEYSMSITTDIKSFVFLSSRKRVKRNSQLQSNGMYVQNVPPLISYMFGIAVFLLLPEILSVLYDIFYY
ncbi:MAG: hypothetical protein ACR2LL_12400, partial [Nitrosopumilus sp.]